MFPPKLSKSAIEHSDDDHRDERCDEHDAVKAVQDAAVAGEDGAVVLDAALALDHAGEQVAVDAQHRRHTGQQRNDDIHRDADVRAGKSLQSVGCDGVDHRDDHAADHRAQHTADGTFDRLLGADHGAELVLAEGAACKVGAGVAAPGKAEDQQDEKDRIIAVFRHRQQLLQPDERIEAEHHDARKHHKTAGLRKADGAVAHHEIDGVEQHEQERSRHDQRPPDGIAGQHDQQRIRHGDGVQQPVLLFEAEGHIDLVDGDEGDGSDHKVEDHRVKGKEHTDQNEDAHHGGYDSCFHRVFLLGCVCRGWFRCRRTGGSAC